MDVSRRRVPRNQRSKIAVLEYSVVVCFACLILWGCSPKPAPIQTANQIGASLFAVNCAICHGAEGKGDGVTAASMNPKPPRLDTTFLTGRGKFAIEAAIRDGVKRDGKQTMPPANKVTEAEVKSLTEYLFVLALESEDRK